jgi:capsular exopolysaccharide synthesis family protein
MSSSAWVKSADKVETGNMSAEAQANSNGHLVQVRADAVYPLLVDREQVIASEHFSVLRSRILNLQAKSGMRSLIVTSAQKGEGKSLVCMNLAISLAQLEKYRILLVDGDLRVKGVSHLLRIAEAPGVSDFLCGKEPLENCIRATDFPHLCVAAAGTHSEDSLPNILEGSRWPAFLEQVKEMADLIIVDSVPVAAPIADFELLSAPCDATLLIVHLRKTTREALNLTLQQMDKKLLGVVINNQEPRIGFDYYSYYYAKKK